MKEKKPAGYWTYDRCFAEAKKYKFKMDFRKGSAGAYDAAKDKGWLAEYTWLESRSLVKWTYDTCYEEAKKYNTRSSFGKKAGAAYKVALENGWLEDYSWFISDRKPVGYWTYERCREEAMKCHMRSEFASKSSVAYDHARKNGWLEDYIWFTTDTTPSGYWTFERCYEEAKKYKRKKDFLDANPRAYRAAYAKGWLKNYTWFESRIKWTYETCYAVAKQCKTKRDFEKAYGRAYQVARKNGWLQDYEWMVFNRVDVINGEFDNVYSYYFDDYNAIYIGRTIRPRRRDREHIFNTKNDTVARFAFEHNCPVPPMIILEDGLSLKKGQEREDYWINYYKEQGYIILNSARTGVGIGSLGTIGGTKWTKGKCYKEAQKYTYRKEFQRGSVGAYTHALKMGWIKDYIWFNRPQNWNQKWDNNTCYEEALKYHTTGDFKLNSPRAYEVSRKKGWIKDYVWLENTVRCISKKWTYEVCLELAKKFKTREEFKKSYRTACQVARVNGWFKEYTWLEKNNDRDSFWTKEECFEEAKKYITKAQFEKGCPSAYNMAKSYGWFSEYTWFENGHALEGIKRRKWSYESCYEAAKKFKKRSDFMYAKGLSRAYKVARANGWLDDYTWFEEYSKPAGFWTFERCADESRKYTSRGEFKRNNPSAYTISLRNGWIKDFTWLETKKKWTYEECKDIASLYSCRSAFKAGDLRAYNASHAHKWMDDFFPPKK